MGEMIEPYYKDEYATIYHAKCEEVIPRLEPVNLVFTSPPYNMGTTTGHGFHRIGHYSEAAAMNKRGGQRKWANPALANGYGTHDDKMPMDKYIQWQREILTLLWGKLTAAGAIYYNHKPRVLGGNLLTPLEYNPGLPLRQIVIWARAGGINSPPTFYCSTHEWIMIFAKPNFKLRDRTASGVGDVWRIPQEINTPHPAPFPLALAKRVLETTTPSVVLDPFAGSGTVARAAKDLGIQSISVEVEEKNCEMAAKRLSQETIWSAIGG